jgi:hypothetical protein
MESLRLDGIVGLESRSIIPTQFSKMDRNLLSESSSTEFVEKSIFGNKAAPFCAEERKEHELIRRAIETKKDRLKDFWRKIHLVVRICEERQNQ